MNEDGGSTGNLRRPTHECLLMELGEQRRRDIAQLKSGQGSLADQICAAVSHSCASLGIDDTKEVVPVVLIYRRRKPTYVVTTAERSSPTG